MLTRLTCVASATIIAGLAPAASAQTRVDPVAGEMPAAMRAVLGIQLSRDSLASTKARLGPTTEWHTGDAGESTWWWCYRVGETAVIFSSDSEMGGSGHEVDHIRVTHTSRVGPDLARCALAHDSTPVQTAGGLRLSLDTTTVRRLLGTPLHARGDSVLYAWTSEQPIPPTHPAYAAWNARRTECFDGKAPFTHVYAEIIVRFDRGVVSEFVLARSDNATC